MARNVQKSRNASTDCSFFIAHHCVTVISTGQYPTAAKGIVCGEACLSCCFGTTCDTPSRRLPSFGLPMVSLVWHNEINFSQELRRFLWQAQKASNLGLQTLGFNPCQFYPLEERLYE
jgi:hypothetical protein